METFFAATLPLAVSPSPAPPEYSFVEPSPAIPWSVVTLGVAIFILPFVFIMCFRRLTRLTRVALWLVPWPPVAVSGWLLWAHYDPSLLAPRCFPTTPQPWIQVAYVFLMWGSFLAFASGLILLSIAGIRRLIRSRRVSV